MEELAIGAEFIAVTSYAVYLLIARERGVIRADTAHPPPLHFCLERIKPVRQHHERVIQTGAFRCLFLLHILSVPRGQPP